MPEPRVALWIDNSFFAAVWPRSVYFLWRIPSEASMSLFLEESQEEVANTTCVRNTEHRYLMKFITDWTLIVHDKWIKNIFLSYLYLTDPIDFLSKNIRKLLKEIELLSTNLFFKIYSLKIISIESIFVYKKSIKYFK